MPSGDQFKFQRTYPGGPMYAPVTGYLTLFGAPTGIEGAMNGELSGTANQQFLDQLNQIITGQSPKGAAVELTINPAAQQAAWDALAGAGLTGAVIAIDPKTGAVLAMVSNPTFDPNALASHDTEAVDALYESLLNDPSDPLINRTIAGDLDPPGSTFKLVTGATAFENGISPDQRLRRTRAACSSRRATTSSSTPTAAAAAAAAMCHRRRRHPALLQHPDGAARTAARLARDVRPGREVRVQQRASTSRSRPSASVYPRALDEPQTMLSAFGQYTVRASPLQMAMVSAAIANGGQVMIPNMVETVTSPDLRVVESFQPQVAGHRPSARRPRATLNQIMVSAVSNGSGTNAIIDGVDVAGKTGTAENGDGPFSLWFTGFAPANDPRVAVAVVVQDGGGLGQSGTGNELAAPIAKAVMEAVLFG